MASTNSSPTMVASSRPAEITATGRAAEEPPSPASATVQRRPATSIVPAVSPTSVPSPITISRPSRTWMRVPAGRPASAVTPIVRSSDAPLT